MDGGRRSAGIGDAVPRSLALIRGSSGWDRGRSGSAGSRGRPAGLPRPRGPARLSKRPREALTPLRAAAPAPAGHSPPRPAPPGPGAALHGSRPPARASVDPPGTRPGLLRRHRRRSPAGGSEPHSHRRPGSDAQVCARAGGAGGQEPGAGQGLGVELAPWRGGARRGGRGTSGWAGPGLWVPPRFQAVETHNHTFDPSLIPGPGLGRGK